MAGYVSAKMAKISLFGTSRIEWIDRILSA